jgi:glycosyltransferase involved in cell wall biosynthesis
MRILMLNNEFPPLGGGTGTVNKALLERFAMVDTLEIDLITSALGRTREIEQFSDHIRLLKVPVDNQNIHHSSNRELLTYAAGALAVAWRLHHRKPFDLCFAWSAVPAGGVALAMRRLAGLPYLVRVCGPDIPGFEQRYGALYPILTPAIKAIWHGAGHVVAKCSGEADMIHRVDPGIEVMQIPNGVELHAFTPATFSQAGPLRLLCVARLIERKGQHHLIEAVRNLVDLGIDVTLDLVGTGDAQAANEVLARERGVAGRIRFRGYVPREQIAAEYAGADVFVLPSYNEGMSVATLEAMAAGLPVVVTRTGGAAELVAEGVNGFVFDWSDIATLTAHLAFLASDRCRAAQMGAASRTRAALFSWEAAAGQYQELFSAMAQRVASTWTSTPSA